MTIHFPVDTFYFIWITYIEFAFDFLNKTGMLHNRKSHANKNYNSYTSNVCMISKNFIFYIGSICFGVSDQR